MAEAAAKEPSMEEILSSIRRIIAEESNSENEDQTVTEMEMEPEPVVPDMPVETTSAENGDELQSAADIATTETEVEELEVKPAPSVMESGNNDENPTGSQAAETARSLAAIAEDIKSDNTPVAVANSLASIAASIDPPEAATKSEPDNPAPPAAPEAEVSSQTEQQEPVEIEEVASVTDPVPTNQDNAPDEAEAFRGALMSPSADGAVSDSFDRLKRSAEDDLDAKTEAILRPMLREWLDENLPTLVEKLVRREIERVARGH